VIRVTENLGVIRDLLAQASLDAGRPGDVVRLLAVSKKQPLEAILAAAAAGQRDFGENFVQEGLQKINACPRHDLRWHFIGHLQANKTRDVAENFHWVHTVDRIKIAARLSAQRPDTLPDLNVCLQVNIDNEPSKSGVTSGELTELAHRVLELPRIRLRGLMCLPAMRQEFDAQRQAFAGLRHLYETLLKEGMALDTLSMGMSEDFRAAIFEGSTMVRIGTAVFGPRPGA